MTGIRPGATSRARIAEVMSTYAPGVVQDYAESSALFTTTNTSLSSTAAGSLMPGMTLDVVGTGRLVELRGQLISYRHSAGASQSVNLYLVTSVDGGADSVATFPKYHANPTGTDTTAQNRSAAWSWIVLTEVGKTYTFKLAVAGGAAGTSRVNPDAASLNLFSFFLARNA